MTEAESKVINLIECSNNPTAALDVAFKLILEFLELPQDGQYNFVALQEKAV